MNKELSELFNRFIDIFHSVNNDNALKCSQPQFAETSGKIPIHTVLVNMQGTDSAEVFAVIAMTVPSFSTDDPGLLEFVVRRSRAHKALYFVSWNLRDAKLWKTPSPGTSCSRDAIEKLRDYSDIYEISGTNLIYSEPIKIKILNRGKDIISDLKKLLKDEALELVTIDATYFVGRLLDAVNHLLPMVTESIRYRLESDKEFRNEIEVWAVKQSIAGSYTDSEFAKSIGRHIIYRLLGKVLFYKSLRRSAKHLPKLDLKGVDSSQVLPTLRAAFALALKIDYHAVFSEDTPDRIQWPSNASLELAGLLNDFNTRNFDHLPQDVVGTVFERLIPPEERHALGQYFTNENLCDLITAFCIRSANDCILDPTCGTGTFLIRAYDRLRWKGQHDHVKLLSQIWGVDIAPFPAELAVINLFRQRIAEHGNFPRIICKDFLKLSPGDRFPFPPSKMDMEHPSTIEEPIPLFDAIVGNFPYVNTFLRFS